MVGLAFACSHLVGIGGDDRVDRLLDGAGVGDLLHAALLDDLGRVAALGPDDLEQILGDLAGDRAGGDEIDDAAELRGGDRAGADVEPFLVQAAEQLVDDPVRGGFAVAALSNLPRRSRRARCSATSTSAS